MTTLFFDTCLWGLDSGTAQDVGWDTSNPDYLTPGGPFSERYATRGLSVTKTFGVNVAKIFLGHWFSPQATAARWWHLRDGTSVQVSIDQLSNNSIQIRNGTAGTILGSFGPFPNTAWRWIEWEVPFGNSVTVKCRVDGSEVISASSVDTTTTANSFITNVLASNASGSDDVMWQCVTMVDDQGSIQNTYLGPQRGRVLLPTSDGTFTNWTASAGSKFAALDESPTTNSDTDYISTSTAGDKYSANFTDMPTSGTVNGIRVAFWARRDDAGPRTMRAFIRNGSGTIHNFATETLAASYTSYSYLLTVSPFTSAAWTKSELDGCEFGVELIT